MKIYSHISRRSRQQNYIYHSYSFLGDFHLSTIKTSARATAEHHSRVREIIGYKQYIVIRVHSDCIRHPVAAS
jgi:hypothetical protein